MKVSLYRRPKGIVLTATQDTEVEVKIPKITTKVVEGRTTADDEVLAGKRFFQRLDLVGTVTDSETAEKAVRELVKIRELVLKEERMKLNKLEAVMEYMEKTLKDEGIGVKVE